MPSSDTVIKAENVKLLRRRSESSSATDILKSAAKEDKNRFGRKTDLRDDDQEKWLKISDALKKEFYEKGFSEGIEFKKNEFLSSLSAMTEAITELRKLKTNFYRENEGDVLELVLAVARKVIHAEVSINRDVVLSVLREAVKKITDENGLKIRFNPDDLRFIMEMKNELLQENQIFENAVFEEDAEIGKGGVLLETDHLEVDARLDRQFDNIKELFKI